MRTRYVFSSIGLILALVALPYSPLVGSAMAADGFCVYENRDLNGWPPWGASQCFTSAGNVKPELNDMASSLKNNTHTMWCAFVDADQGGYSLPVGAGSHFSDLARDTAPDGNSWNDRISSVGAC
jgi:peptidase inhibitor family I36